MGVRNASEQSPISTSSQTILVLPPGLLGIPFWFDDSFHMTYRMLISPLCTLQKNVYSVFRANPPSIGFAQLSSVAGGSGERENSLVLPVTSSSLLPFQARQTVMIPQQPMALVALEAAVRFPLVSDYLYLMLSLTADGGSSIRITLPTMMTTTTIVVLICLL